MKVLMVFPKFRSTFWGWEHALPFAAKKAAFPPLGLLTVAAMLPGAWWQNVADLNVRKLADSDLRQSDFVLISAMITQKDSAKEVIARCNRIGVPAVLGGPILEQEQACEEFKGVSHFFIGEAEETVPKFLADLKAGQPKRIYKAEKFPDIALSPVPRFELINSNDYASMLAQYSRGCPYACDYCNVAAINGHVPRAKNPSQFFAELDAIHRAGFRGTVTVADDNFIGKKRKNKEMLPGLISWQRKKGYPFKFKVELPVTIADDSEHMRLLAEAGVEAVFLGLETPNQAALAGCCKWHNVGRDLAADARKICNHGLIPMSGGMLGFDEDDPATIFDEHIELWRRAGVVIVMPSVLQAQPGTKLYERLKQEGRLLTDNTGNNTDSRANFVTKIPADVLEQGHKWVMRTLYSPKEFYERICVFLENFSVSARPKPGVGTLDFMAFVRSIGRIGLLGEWKTSYYYWKSLALAVLKKPRAFPDVVAFWIYREHLWQMANA